MTPTEDQIARARRIALETIPHKNYARRGIAYSAALAAIMETQEACAKVAETFGETKGAHGPALVTRRNIAAAIRAGEQP